MKTVVTFAALAGLSLVAAIAPGHRHAEDPASIMGTWTTQERHLAMGSLFQPHHATRERTSQLVIALEAGKLTGYSITDDHTAISGQEDWKDGRTEFRKVAFADGKLLLEFNIKDVRHGSDRKTKSKAIIRIEAVLQKDRLVGKWGLFLEDGSEPFRGEFEAERGKDEAK